jgi:hypothetical protein
MRKLSETDLIAWIRTRGIALHESYPTAAILTFRPDLGHDRSWQIPPAPERRPYFVATMLDLLGDWASCFVWKHSGSWPSSANPERINDVVELRILSGLGLPLGTSEVVEFGRAEFDSLVTLIFSSTIFGWSVRDDLYVIPDHARCIMQTDHHDVVHVSFRDGEDLKRFVAGMENRGFPLPDDAPDATFKTRSWMKGD